MHVVGIIPARYDSSRFPGKPLIDLKGKTMIQRVYEGAIKSDLIHEVIVATDDQRIYDEVIRFGGKVVLTSPHHKTGTDRCAEVAALLNTDVIINIQGDEPLVDYRQLNQLISAFKDENVQIATLATRKIATEDLHNPNRIKVVVNQNQNAIYFSRSAVPNATNLNEDAMTFYPYLRHIGLYGFRSTVLNEITELNPTLLEQVESLEQLRWLYYGYSIHVVETNIETPNIDTPEDLNSVLELL